jgi:CheY-like chemotaxis protein
MSLQSKEISGGNPAWKILVVDDESAVSSLMKLLLERDGHSVQTVDNGIDALFILQHKKFDLVTTDFSMTGMKGDTLATTIKELQPNLPVLMISSNGALAKACGDPLPGVDMVIGKPFTVEDLRKAMAEVLHKGVSPRL